METAPLKKRLSGELLHVISGSGYIFACRIFGAGVAFLTQVLLARWMGAEELGRYVLAYSWLMMLAVIPVSGQIGAAMRFIGQGISDDNPGYVRGFIRYATVFVLIGSVATALMGGAFFIGFQGPSGSTQMLYLAAMIGVPAMALIKLNCGMANAFSRFSLSFLPNNVFRPLLYLAGLLAVWLWLGELNAESAMWIHLAALVLIVTPLIIYFHRSTRKELNQKQPVYEVSLWTNTAMSMLFLGIFTNYFAEIMVITTGFFVPDAELGIYNAALRLALLTKFGLFAIDAFNAPSLTRHYRRNEHEKLVRAVRLATILRILSALIPFITFVLVGEFVLGLFGTEFKAGHTVLIILGAAYLPVSAVGPAVLMLNVSGFHTQALKSSLFAMVLWLVIAPPMVSTFGIVGAATSGLITLTAWSAALWYSVRRYLSINTLAFLSRN